MEGLHQFLLMEKNNKYQKKILLSALILIVLFLAGVFYVATKQIEPGGEVSKQERETKKGAVIFEQPNLYLFGTDRQVVSQFPDRIKIHYPYLLVITPGNQKQTTTIYDLEKRQKIQTENKVLLDFDGAAVLSTDGKTTFYNKQDLGVFCDQGWIKNATTILCVTAKDTDPLDNKLISIHPQTLIKQNLYSSNFLLGTIAVINDDIYLAEIDTDSQNTFISVNGRQTHTPFLVDIVYPMGGNVYYATFKTNTPHRDASYSQLFMENGLLQIQFIEKGRIVFQ